MTVGSDTGPDAATRLFAEAVELVRTAPLEPPDRPPAFHLPARPAAPVRRAESTVSGPAGDVWATSAAIRSGALNVQDVASRSAAAIAAHADRLGAFECLADSASEVEALAAEAAAGSWRGPLHGIPVSVKDIIDVAGLPTTGSSGAIAPRVPAADACAVARLRAAGAIIVGKATTHEFALGVTTPQSRNPWDETRVPGGSSGGSVISIVTGMALASLGTDTRASIRVPAALSGAVGFKPSLGVVPIDNWLTLSWTMDHFAPMARSVRDIALLMDVLARPAQSFREALPGSLAGARIGWSDALLAGTEPAIRARFEAALEAAAGAGATVSQLGRPDGGDLALANAAGMVVSRAEAAHFHHEGGTAIDLCMPEVRSQLRAAAGLRATDYIRAMRLRGQLRDNLERVFEEVDILAMPTSKVVAPIREEAGRYLLVLSENCIPWSFVDFPAISLFAGMAEGLPSGIQLVGAPGSDHALLASAHAIEATLPPVKEWSPR